MKKCNRVFALLTVAICSGQMSPAASSASKMAAADFARCVRFFADPANIDQFTQLRRLSPQAVFLIDSKTALKEGPVPLRFKKRPLDLSETLCNVYRLRPRPYQYLEDIEAAGSGESAFVVAGVNSNELLAKMPTLTAVAMKDLTLRARPSETPDSSFSPFQTDPLDLNLFAGLEAQIWLRRSSEGWLAESETLRERLIKDNTFVLSQHLTHQMVAHPLLKIVEQAESQTAGPLFIYINQRPYRVDTTYMPGGGSVKVHYLSPLRRRSSGWRSTAIDTASGSFFNDQLFYNWSFEITDLETQERLSGDALTPHLIYRYGFYQGGPYRIAPREIIRFFRIQPESDTAKRNESDENAPRPERPVL